MNIDWILYQPPKPSYDVFHPCYRNEPIPHLELTGNKNMIIWVFHGNAIDAGLEINNSPILQRLNKYGFTVCCAEYIGYGSRYGDSPSSKIICEDVNKLVKWWHRRQLNIYLIGQSIGTGPALQASASRYSGIKGLTLISPFLSISNLANDYIPFGIGKYLVKDPFPSDENISKTKCPIQIYHGINDSIISINHSRSLANKTKNAQLTAIHCDHNDIIPLIAGQVCRKIILLDKHINFSEI